jgi:hypothetical protein
MQQLLEGIYLENEGFYFVTVKHLITFVKTMMYIHKTLTDYGVKCAEM